MKLLKKITNNQYNDLVNEKTPGSSLISKSLKAFVTGGLICTIAQIIFNLLLSIGLDEKTVSSFTSISMVFLGALFTGLGLYNKMAKFGGAGTLVPITGFANAVVSPALEFKSEGYILGLGAKMFIIAGPVLVYGVTASIVCGLLVILSRMVF
ncbi:MAG: stage V sporulation protein AC [Ruminococcaceae bacterium]|nr:stage V sporulation protein AC [Oscillospiraceae bacterium]